MIDPDIQFFQKWPERQARIRFPDPHTELHREFNSLGDHKAHRRRVIVWRVPKDNPYYQQIRQPMLKIPFLAFAEEAIEDTDATVLPIIQTIMSEALENGGGCG